MDQNEVGRRLKRMKYDDVDGSFRKFDGAEDQNIFVWMEAFDRMCTDAKWDEFEKVTYLRKSIKDVAYDAVLMDGGDSYNSIKDVLLTQFGGPWKPCHATRRILARRRKLDETPIQYMTDMRRLGNAARLNDATIAKFVVDGLDVEPIWKFVLSRITDLVELRMAIEDAEHYMKESTHVQEEIERTTAASTEYGICQRRRTFEKNDGEVKILETPVQVDVGRTMFARSEERRSCFCCNKIGHVSRNCPERQAQGGYEAFNVQKKTTSETPPRPRFSRQDLKEEESFSRAVGTRYEERRKCFTCNSVGHISVNCTRRRESGQPDEIKCQGPLGRQVTGQTDRRAYQSNDSVDVDKRRITNGTPARVKGTGSNTAKDHEGARVDRRALIVNDHCDKELMVERIELFADRHDSGVVVPEVDERSRNDRGKERTSECNDNVKTAIHGDALNTATKMRRDKTQIPDGSGVDQETRSMCARVATVDEVNERQINHVRVADENDVQCIVDKEDVIARDKFLATGRDDKGIGFGVGASATCDNGMGTGDKEFCNSLAWAGLRGYMKAFRRGFV